MNDVEIIEPTEDESCCSCRTDNVRLYKWTGNAALKEGDHQHCDLCYETEFGRRCNCRHTGYGDAMDVMRHMVQLAHILRRGAVKS